MNVNFSILLNNLIKEFNKNNFYKVYLEGKKLVDIKNVMNIFADPF